MRLKDMDGEFTDFILFSSFEHEEGEKIIFRYRQVSQNGKQGGYVELFRSLGKDQWQSLKTFGKKSLIVSQFSITPVSDFIYWKKEQKEFLRFFHFAFRVSIVTAAEENRTPKRLDFLVTIPDLSAKWFKESIWPQRRE